MRCLIAECIRITVRRQGCETVIFGKVVKNRSAPGEGNKETDTDN